MPSEHPNGAALSDIDAENADRFVTNARNAADELASYWHGDATRRSFEQTFLRPIRDWCEAHAERVQACYVPPAKGRDLELFVVGVAEKCDFEFSGRVIELGTRLFDAGWRVTPMYVLSPEDEAEGWTFFDPNDAILVYAQRQPTSS